MIHDNHHHFLISKLLNSQMSKVYAFQAVMTFVKSLIGIFVPVYLFSLGFDFIHIVFFGMGLSFMYLLAIPFTVKLLSKIGFKYMLLSSVPFYLFHIYSIQLITQDHSYFHLAWISFGLYSAFFWPAFHSEVALNSSKKHTSAQVGTLQVISIIFASLAPIIGGFILQFSSYYLLLLFSILVIFLGALPLLFSKEIPLHKFSFSYRDYFRLAKQKRYSISKKVFASEGFVIMLSLIIWPVILYILLLQNFFLLGALYTFVSFLSVILLMYLKSYLDTHPREKVLKISTRYLAFNWLIKIFALTFSSLFLYLVEGISRLVTNVYYLTYSSLFYMNAKESQNYLEYILLREFFAHGMKVIFGAIIIIILSIFGQGLNIISMILVAGLLAQMVIAQYTKE